MMRTAKRGWRGASGDMISPGPVQRLGRERLKKGVSLPGWAEMGSTGSGGRWRGVGRRCGAVAVAGAGGAGGGGGRGGGWGRFQGWVGSTRALAASALAPAVARRGGRVLWRVILPQGAMLAAWASLRAARV